MSSNGRNTKSGRQSLFFNDLATPVSSRRGKFSSPGQAAAVSALWRENFATSDLPPPPVFTLEDRLDFSPEPGIMDYPLSPETKSGPRSPKSPNKSSGRELSTPLKNKSEASTSNGLTSSQQNQQVSLSLNWWSPGKSTGDLEDKGKGSPVDGVVQSGALITLPPQREVARPELQRSSVPVANLNGEEWVTVFGHVIIITFATLTYDNFTAVWKFDGILLFLFSPADTNLVLREFEKCGLILKHVPGPRNANWMHVLYQTRADAQKALSKNGMQINEVLIVGVKPVDPMQRRALDERANRPGFMPLPPSSSGLNSEQNHQRTVARPNYLQNGSGTVKQSGAIASPAKSVVSKIVDLMFGV